MLVELHSLTSHAPANLNRDDLGRPKSAMFGGTNRARISSQAIKRSIRTSNYLEDQLGSALSTRSRQIPELVFNALSEKYGDDEKKVERAQTLCEAFSNVLGKADKKKPLHTSQIVFLTAGEIERSQKYISDLVESDQKLTKKFVDEFTGTAADEIDLDENPGDGVDLALFGRMTTDKANAFLPVDASMQVAHAISTHTVVPETDWFTAVDDFRSDDDDSERGSGHIGELEFNSAVYYKYFSCNLPLLIRNMNGAGKEAAKALSAVLDAGCRVTPSGKQNSFASHSPADTILIVRRRQRIPVTLANAFEQPVHGEENGHLNESRARMIRHYSDIHSGYGLDDQAALFCIDSDARKELKGSLPTHVNAVDSVSALFKWLDDGLAGEVKK